jgi:hypothetical protein
MRVRWLVLLVGFCVFAGSATAETATSAKVPSDVSVLAYGAAHPECLEWTDSCRTCIRSPDSRVGCSTPGIACQPKDIECKKEGK